MTAAGDDRMALSLVNFDSLIEKYASEIDQLRDAMQGETDASVREEIDMAIKESEPLVNDLHVAREVFAEVEATGRPLTDDEIAAFEYFGFDVVPHWRTQRRVIGAAPSAPPAPVYRAQTPPQPVPVSGRAMSLQSELESETDPDAAYATNRAAAYRALTPDYDDGMVVDYRPAHRSVAAVPVPMAAPRAASPAPLAPPMMNPVQVALTSSPSLPPPPASPRYTEDDVDERAHAIAQRLIAEERAAMEREFAMRPPKVDEAATARIVAVEVEKTKRWASEMIESYTTEYKAKTDALQQECDDVRAALAASKAVAADDAQRARIAAEKIRSDFNASNARAARQEWIDFVQKNLVPVAANRFQPVIDGLRKEVGELSKIIEGDLAQLRDRVGGIGARPDTSLAVSTALDAAREALSLSSSCSQPPTFVMHPGSGANAYGQGAESDSLDRAVLEELAALRIPADVAVRRLGPHGDYFIDRRLQLRLMNGKVFVKRIGAQVATYEPFAKYVVRLYLPALSTDVEAALRPVLATSPGRGDGYSFVEASVSPPHRGQHSSVTAHSASTAVAMLELSPTTDIRAPPATTVTAVEQQTETIRRLQREQQALTEQLAAQRQLLARHSTPLHHQPAHHQQAHHLDAAPQPTPSRISTHPAQRSHAPTSAATLATLSDEEVELLKKLALAKQLRDNRRQHQTATRHR